MFLLYKKIIARTSVSLKRELHIIGCQIILQLFSSEICELDTGTKLKYSVNYGANQIRMEHT